MSPRDWNNIKDWDRESIRLDMANSAGVKLEEIILPGDDDPNLNVVLRNKRESEINECDLEIDAHNFSGDRRVDEGVPSIEDMMLFDALDGKIDGDFNVFGE